MLTAFYRDVYPRRAAQAAGCRCSFQCESAAVASSTCVFYPLRHAQYLLLLLLACAHPSRICCPVCARIHTCPPLLFSLSLSLFLRLIAKHVCSTRSRVLPCARYQEARACISPLGEEHRERGTGRRRRRSKRGAGAAWRRGKTVGACARASSIFMRGTVTWGKDRRLCGRDTPVLVNEADVDKWCVSPRETYNR